MADFVFNVAKGKINEYVARVVANDPANSALVIVGINTSEADGTLQDLDTLAAVLANGNTAELANTGYARTVYTDADLSAPSPDDSNNRQEADMPDIDWGQLRPTTPILPIFWCAMTRTRREARIAPLYRWCALILR